MFGICHCFDSDVTVSLIARTLLYERTEIFVRLIETRMSLASDFNHHEWLHISFRVLNMPLILIVMNDLHISFRVINIDISLTSDILYYQSTMILTKGYLNVSMFAISGWKIIYQVLCRILCNSRIFFLNTRLRYLSVL